MFYLKGACGNATVFTDLCEIEAQTQILYMLNHPISEGAQVRIMPDVHAGKGCTIGTTMTLTNKVIPNLVGVDIGCGMKVTYLDAESIDFAKLDKVIRDLIPSGHEINAQLDKTIAQTFKPALKQMRFRGFDELRELCAIGSLGGGNHFIEVNQTANGRYVLVIHSGSRHLGIEVATHYQNVAITAAKVKAINWNIIEALKAQGRHKEISATLAQLKAEAARLPKELAYLEGSDMDDYLNDIAIVQKFAAYNRQIMTERIMSAMGWNAVESFETIHNYIDVESMILRKGAVSARKGEKLIIPMNMRDGSLVCVGKGNPDWNYSAPHGAGRLMSRGQAKRELTMDEFTDSMKGIYTTSVCSATLDESPMAYKPMESIVENVVDTVQIMEVIKPVYNFKASN